MKWNVRCDLWLFRLTKTHSGSFYLLKATRGKSSCKDSPHLFEEVNNVKVNGPVKVQVISSENRTGQRSLVPSSCCYHVPPSQLTMKPERCFEALKVLDVPLEHEHLEHCQAHQRHVTVGAEAYKQRRGQLLLLLLGLRCGCRCGRGSLVAWGAGLFLLLILLPLPQWQQRAGHLHLGALLHQVAVLPPHPLHAVKLQGGGSTDGQF